MHFVFNFTHTGTPKSVTSFGLQVSRESLRVSLEHHLSKKRNIMQTVVPLKNIA